MAQIEQISVPRLSETNYKDFKSRDLRQKRRKIAKIAGQRKRDHKWPNPEKLPRNPQKWLR